jgi:hypothetical protein
MNHQAADRVPVNYLAIAIVTKNLKKYFGVTTERELLDKLNADFYYLSFRDMSPNESCLAKTGVVQSRTTFERM